MPVDELELDRIDQKHRLYTILLGDKLFLAPISPNPQRVLDLGTGSGRYIKKELPSCPVSRPKKVGK